MEKVGWLVKCNMAPSALQLTLIMLATPRIQETSKTVRWGKTARIMLAVCTQVAMSTAMTTDLIEVGRNQHWDTLSLPLCNAVTVREERADLCETGTFCCAVVYVVEMS